MGKKEFESKRKNQLLDLLNRIEHANSIIDSIAEQIASELEGSEFPSENTGEFAFLIQNLLDVLSTHINMSYLPKINRLSEKIQNRKKAKDNISILSEWDEERRKIKKRIIEVTLIGANLTQLIKFVFGSRIDNNPWGLVKSVNVMSRNLFPKARALVRPRWQYDYSYYAIYHQLIKIALVSTKHDSSLRNAIINLIKEAPHFFALAYPPTTATNILQISIWAHELSHSIDLIHGLKRLEFDTADIKLLYRDLITDQVFASRQIARKYQVPLAPEALDAFRKRIQSPDADVEIVEESAKIIQAWAQEIFADIFSVRLFGPAALLSAIEFMLPLSNGLDEVRDQMHPPLRYRLEILLNEYEEWLIRNPNWNEIGKDKEKGNLLEILARKIDCYHRLLESESELIISPNIPTEHQVILRILYPDIGDYLNDLIIDLKNEINLIEEEFGNCLLSNSDIDLVVKGVNDLSHILPPEYILSDKPQEIPPFDNKVLGISCNVGWLYWLSIQHKESQDDISQYLEGLGKYSWINKLLLKGIENFEIKKWFIERQGFGKFTTKSADTLLKQNINEDPVLHQGGALNGIGLRSLLEDNLEIRPTFGEDSQIGSCSIDLRLGNEFIYTKFPGTPKLDPVDIDFGMLANKYERRIFIPYGKPFVIHPGQFVIGGTIEYLKMPNNIMGLIVDRASWRRLGLFVGTPQKIIPGHTGCITLEISNLGSSPIFLYPSTRICQILFFTTTF